MFYSSEAKKLREFLRDVIGLNATDIGEGWLIFDIPKADMGVHPSDEPNHEGSASGTHDIWFYAFCSGFCNIAA